MRQFTTIGRIFVAIAMIIFGIQHFIYFEFVTRAFPVIPAWIPSHAILACIFGAFLLITGLAIIFSIKARTLTVLLGSTIIFTFLILLLPMLMMNLQNGIIWTNSGKALVLAGANFVVAARFPKDNNNWLVKTLEKLIPLGPYLLAGFFILAGTLHFIYAPYVATLIPLWIPAHLFWAYFTGVALIAAAIGILIPKTTRLAATLAAIMIFLWVVLLHFPRAISNLHDANETTSFFEALAMCGTAILIAVSARQGKKIK